MISGRSDCPDCTNTGGDNPVYYCSASANCKYAHPPLKPIEILVSPLREDNTYLLKLGKMEINLKNDEHSRDELLETLKSFVGYLMEKR